MAHHIFRGIAQLVEQRSPKPRAEGSSPSAPAKTKRHLRVSFCFVVKAEGLEPRNSKVLALLTVNSPVDCLRIELIIKPLPKKHRFFGAFFLYLRCFTAILLVFPILIKLRRTDFSVRRFLIFALFFVHFVSLNPPKPFGTSSKKHQSQFKSVCNAQQHIRVSFDIIHFGYF